MIKLCPCCGSQFESGFAYKTYCSLRCKKRQETRRRVAREGKQASPVATSRPDVFAEVHNPTRERLDYVAKAYTDGLELRPSIFTGTIPEGWTAPPGVSFEQSFVDKSWLMERDGGRLP